ncbi:MAG: LD-carboxypeptidase, partial [Thermodesulfobacteriota bacterium]|nr:LD-carboxypeptidase [Thermodesulfobacteriota bacterium]
ILKLLKPGDTIGVCAPSGSFDMEKFEQGVEVIRNMGFVVHVPKGLDKKKRYLAGSDKHRAKVLNNLFFDDNINGIICARGGFGALRILPFIDYSVIKKCPKPFVGFSDASALLSVFEKRCMLKVFHGPVVTSLADSSNETVDSLFKVLTSSPSNLLLQNGRTICPGDATGIFSGGNLATICHLTGTDFQPDFNGKILFLEDVGEAPYKIDRMLYHMKMAGVFDGVKGVVAGSFHGCGDGNMIDEILEEAFDEFQIPILAGLDAGHGEHNFSLPLGAGIELDADNHSLLFF